MTTPLKNISPRKGPVDRTFIAQFQGEKVSVYAPSIAAANQKAIEHFKPKRRERSYLQVFEAHPS